MWLADYLPAEEGVFPQDPEVSAMAPLGPLALAAVVLALAARGLP